MACVDAATVKASITTKSLITHSSICKTPCAVAFCACLGGVKKIWVVASYPSRRRSSTSGEALKRSNELPISRALLSSGFFMAFYPSQLHWAASHLKANGASASSKLRPPSTHSTESHHEQASYRYRRFGHRFFAARFGSHCFSSARSGITYGTRFRAAVSRHSRRAKKCGSHRQQQSTEQGSQSWDVTGQINDPERPEAN
jgi:hypothetical protein